MTAALAPGSLRAAAVGTLMASFPGPSLPAWLLRQVESGLGSVALYGSNRSADVGAVAAAVHGARPSCIVALDEEGGDVTRIEATTGSSLPGNAALGAVDDVSLTFDVASALGARLRSLGVDLDLAPCADVNADPDNPVIGVRSFGADPDLVARHTAAFVTGLQAAGVAACAKHFPGHGAVTVDSHVALPVVTSLGERELAPFRAAVSCGVAAVMPGHLLVPSLDDAPASVSRRILVDLLRDDLGFAGVIVTDALDMGGISGPAGIPDAVVRALAAGADLCCLGPDNDDALVAACVSAIEAAVGAGDLTEERVRSANEHLAAHTTDIRRMRRQIDRDLADLADVGRTAARRALRVSGELPADLAGAHVVELARPANIAAGSVPGGATASLLRVDPAATATRVVEGEDRAVAHALVAASGRPLVVVSRDAHRRPAQAAALRTLLTARPDAVHVEEGWPGGGDPPAAARVLTYGASPACGDAVADLLLGRITCG
jgi:beta-N-acetylhexosaminidase